MELRDASAPFNKATADVILRSSDLCDFRVRKAILAEASSVFEDMFDLPRPPHTFNPGEHESSADIDEHRDGLPVVAVQEDSSTLDLLLRICYPVLNPSLDTPEVLSPVLAAAVKYDMDGAIATIRGDLRRLAERHPVVVCCLSMHYGFIPEAEAAARASLGLGKHGLIAGSQRLRELGIVGVNTMSYLRDYQQACADALPSFTRHLPFTGSDWVWFACDEGPETCPKTRSVISLGDQDVTRVATWWFDYMTLLDGTLQVNPGADVTPHWLNLFVSLEKAYACPQCGRHAAVQMNAFLEGLETYVEDQLLQVRRLLAFCRGRTH